MLLQKGVRVEDLAFEVFARLKFFLPFFVAAGLAIVLYRCPPIIFREIAKETFARLRNPVIALFAPQKQRRLTRGASRCRFCGII